MKKQDLIESLESLYTELANLRQSIQKIQRKRVWITSVINESKRISVKWFESIEPVLSHYGTETDIISEYHERFDKLLRLASRSGPAKTSFIDLLGEIITKFTDEIIIEIQKYSDSGSFMKSVLYIESILQYATEEEKDYLIDAIKCANVGVMRAAVIMGWNAAIYRMHKRIEELGFEEFNKKTKEMKSKTTGRYKRFNSEFDISSINELQTQVFDTILFWILEYLGLIDSNQHHRLSTCYVMRCNSAHPGEAPISEENLTSFFSDLQMIVFANPDFKLSSMG